jgi:hypothetical protein
VSGETEDRPSGWTTDTLHIHIIRQLGLMQDMSTERHRAQGEAIDKAFSAQQAAMQAAFLAQQQSAESALSAQDRAVTAALAAAKEAVTVANEANEKRFESVNEFRGQLSDIIRTLMPRAEAEAVISRATERLGDIAQRAEHWATRSEVTAASERTSERIADVASRLDRLEAKGVGAKENRAGIYASIAAVGVLLGIVVVVANLLAGG